MPKLRIEETDREKPIILIVGSKNPLIDFIITEYQKEFKIALVSQDSPVKVSENFYRIDPSSAHLVERLEEKIDYGIIFLDSSERHSLPSIFEKLDSDGAKTAIIVDVQKINNFVDIILELKNRNLFYFLFLGDVYSEAQNPPFESEVSKVIYSAIKNKTIKLTGNDLAPLFPIYQKDALSGINQILFGPKKQQRFYWLFYSHPQTYISAAHILKRVEPDLEIQYNEEGENVSRRLSYEELERDLSSKIIIKPSFLDKYLVGFEASLENFLNYKSEKNVVAEEIRETVSHKKVRKWKIPVIKYIMLSVFFFVVLNFLFAGLALLSLKGAADALQTNDYKKFSASANHAKLFFEIVKPVARIIDSISFFDSSKIKNNLRIAQEVIDLLATSSKDINAFENIQKGVDLEKLNGLIANGFYTYFMGQRLENELALGTKLPKDLSSVLALTSVAPEILGYNKTATYLILLQNNAELRPTGGFIGSVAKVKIDKGKIKSVELNDVYDFDGKLKAHIEPHYIIRRFLQPHLYLRDSNFDPDFQNSASTAALLYNLETGEEVDGVIAVNFDAVKEIIREIGPIDLPRYKITLDENNTFEFLERTIDDNFFPGSSAKRDVLQALFNQIVIRLEDSRNFSKLAYIFPKLLKEKDILFAFNKGSTQAIFSAGGYGGDISDKRISAPATASDFLSINEANIGVNKANATIERDAVYQVDFSGNKILSTLSYRITNTDREALDYHSYFRLITPASSRLSLIRIDGVEQKIIPAVTNFRVYEARNFKAPSGFEVDQTDDAGKQVFGFIVNVPKGKISQIDIVYENGVKIPSEKVLTYSLLFLKQPGVAEYPFTLRLKYDKGFTPQKIEEATFDQDTIILSRKITQDEIFTAKFVKR